MNKQLRIGIILDNEKMMRSQIEILDSILRSDHSLLSLIIYKQPTKIEKKSELPFFLFNLFLKIDKIFFGRGLKYICRESIADKVKNTETLNVSSMTKGNYDYLQLDDIKAIEYYNIDVIIDFSRKITLGDILSAPRYGVWKLVHNNDPEAFWEVVENQPYTEITLQKLSDTLTGGYILDRYRTITDLKSPIRNLETITWRSHMLLERNLNNLYQNSDAFFRDKELSIIFADQPPENSSHGIDVKLHFQNDERRVKPTNSKMAGVFIKMIMKFTKILFRKHFTKLQWILMYAENNKKGGVNLSLLDYKRLLPTQEDLFWADPFIIDKGEISYIFYEEFSPTIKGTLCVILYDHLSQKFSEPKEITNKDYHLSYPFIFNHNDTYYMIPESGQNKTIDLYSAEEFPYKWKKIRTLIDDIVAVDTTLHYYNNIWWMFTNVAPKKGFSKNDELHIFYCSDILNDDWKPHKLNPVITDVTVARNAGTIIEDELQLYRPSQYCGGYYGRQLNINKIVLLNEEEYKEVHIGRATAEFESDLEGLHTLNSSNRLSVIDVGSRKLSFKLLFRDKN